MTLLYNFRDINDEHKPMISEEFYNNCLKYGSEIEDMIDYNRDYNIDYFGFSIRKSYLNKINKTIVERIQHLWMRVALSIRKSNMEKVKLHMIIIKNILHMQHLHFLIVEHLSVN